MVTFSPGLFTRCYKYFLACPLFFGYFLLLCRFSLCFADHFFNHPSYDFLSLPLIVLVSPATKKADLGGIDTPPSANYLVVHHPAKCSVFSRPLRGHSQFWSPLGNHPPPDPLFSLRSQTVTSQLAGFRNKSPVGSLNTNNKSNLL